MVDRSGRLSARTHSVTRLPGFVDRGFLRTDYHAVEDFSATHVVFEDGTVADIFASEIVMGGIHNWLEVMANNHRTVCNINPNTAMQTYNPAEEQFRDIYVVEKIGTKQGWAPTAPDEDFITGFPRRSRRSTGPPQPASGRRATAGSPPTASRRSTARTCRPSARVPRWRFGRIEQGSGIPGAAMPVSRLTRDRCLSILRGLRPVATRESFDGHTLRSRHP
jgi:hypothetical protein